MPGSLLSRVRRSDSARSDRSDVSVRSGDSWKSSGKKVSFNRAVRVKKFPRRADALHDDALNDDDENRFWFRVYKNGDARRGLHPDGDAGDYAGLPVRPLDPIAEVPGRSGMRLTSDVGVGTSGDAPHSSQQSETPTVRRNHVRKLVTRFNEESLLKFDDEEPARNGGPPEPPVDYAHDSKRKNPLVNGVKVIFGGMAGLKNRRETRPASSSVRRKNQANLRRNLFGGGPPSEVGPPYRTNILLADEHATAKNNNNVTNRNRNYEGRLDLIEAGGAGDLVPRHFWDSGDQLVHDTTRYESTVDRNDLGGQTHRTVEEGNRVWKHETRTVYEEEEPPPLSDRRRAKSHGDLRGGDGTDGRLSGRRKGLSVDDLPGRAGATRDRAVQCNRSRERPPAGHSATLPGSLRVIRAGRDGLVSAFSDASTLGKANGSAPQPKTTPPPEAVYSQVDRNKKLLGRKSASTLSLNGGRSAPPSTSPSQQGKVKSSQKSFGFRLKKAFGAALPVDDAKANTYSPARDEEGNWYDVDADVVAADKKGRGSQDEADGPARRETPGSVVREVDHRRREIVYENTPARSKTEVRAEAGGLWYRGAEEDYRREMAHSDVSYPSGSHVGSASTLGRSDWRGSSREVSAGPRSLTLDRRASKPPTVPTSNGGTADVKILVNGREVDDLDALTGRPQPRRKTGENPTRGGLAAAYRARQKAVLGRSNSLSGSRHSVSGLGLSSGASSTASASSDGEASLRRRTLVMYIPAVDHRDHRSDSDDRRSGVSRTQSLHASSRPTKYQKHVRKGAGGGGHSRYSSKTALDEEGDTLTPLRSDAATAAPKGGKRSSSLGRKGELHRRHSMPKDTKFGWFKWKIKPKSREA